MVENQITRIRELLNNLQPEFASQQKPFEPVLQALQHSVQRAKALAFKLYREKCKTSFEDLEKNATINNQADISLKKDDINVKQIKSQIGQVMKCVEEQNPEYAKARKKLIGERKRFSHLYMKCNEDCLPNDQEKSDKEISDCFLSCNKRSLEDYDKVSHMLLKDHTKLVSGLEKL